MKSNLLTQSGSVLIEALVALVIVAVGTFGVVKLNTVMLSGTGLSKTRAEALQYAQTSMEKIRNTGCGSAYTAGGANVDTVTGVNAVYKINHTISSVLPERVNVDVYVGWDGNANPQNSAADKRIILSSVVSCVGIGTSGMIGGNATARTANTVKTPTGAAHVGGGDYGNSKPTGRTLNYIGGGSSGTADGTSTYLNTAGAYELIDESTGKVLLTVNDGSAFSTISGRVYIEADNSGNPIVDPDGASASDISDDNVFVLSSDASYCARSIASTLPVAPTGTSGNAIKYRYFDYRCYVSKGWWGNIGVVRLDNPNTNNRVCVGDPAVSTTETSLWTKKTALSISRGYRAYRELLVDGVGSGVFDTIGMGVSTTDGVTYTPTSIPSSDNAGTEHHDFLITLITGNGTCQSSGKMSLTSPSPFTGNQGRFYCMSGQCPSLTQTPSAPSTLIHGTITKGTGATLSGLSDTDCSSSTLTDNGANYSYSCQLNWTGFSGSAWQGSISFGATGTNTLCSSGNTATVVPSGNSVAFTVNDRLASANPNSLTFTDVPLAVTDVTINLGAAAVSCNTLGQPAPAWDNGNSPRTLSWVSISHANGYKISTCTSTTGVCTPGTQTTQTTTSVTPAPSSGQTICVQVTATDSANTYTDSIASSTKCVTRASTGNSYNYQ